MSAIEGLLKAYERFIKLPWDKTLAGPQKVWFAIYEPAQERRLRFRLPEFELATKSAGHPWVLVDLTDSFGEWMADHEYRDAYFEQPEAMDLALQDFAAFVVRRVEGSISASSTDESTVVAIFGLASLYGLMRASVLLEAVAPSIRGRLLVFFPGQREGSNYRLLDARDGWNYLAVPITATERG
ncbi:MAG: DUF1788 domain-containing protein [Chloroflexi bacterium]|nr:DUF1788 domain-containing protein [Chloroflexota bacterium]